MKASCKNALRKPDAGNLHVRFEEGEGTRRSLALPHLVPPSLLYFITFVPSVSSAVRIFGCGGAALGYWPFLPETNSGMLIGLMRNGCP